MKLARNLGLALALLLLLYGGVYRIFFRDAVRDQVIWGENTELSAFEKRLHRFLIPAAEIDLRLNVDRPVRKGLRGRWSNTSTGDSVTFSENDTCVFRLGRFRYSGKAEIARWGPGYEISFRDGATPRLFEFTVDDFVESGNLPASASATIKTDFNEAKEYGLPSLAGYYKTTLTRSPAPAP